MPFLIIQIVFFIFVSIGQGATTADCEKWFFETAKVEPGTANCETRCAASAVGMDTFVCPLQCKDLCKLYLDRYIVDELTFRYALTSAEKNLIAKYPQDALFVYLAKNEAQKAAKRIFERTAHNDEGDAFRHFVWSALITHKIGEERARLFLDAHEQDPKQPISEKEMDSHNNAQGINEAKRLQSEKAFSTESLEKSALKVLREGKLKVLQPRGTIPDWR